MNKKKCKCEKCDLYITIENLNALMAFVIMSMVTLFIACIFSIFVYINVKVLETLSSRDRNCGMVEIIKHALLLDAELFNVIESGKYDILDIIKRSCEIKASIVTKDEKENSIRVILNLGHTIAHAIESLSKFKISHGEAVALGILHSLKISQKMGKIDGEQVNRIEKVFENIGVLPKLKKGFNYSQIKEYIAYDKKIRDGVLQYIILTKIGNCEILQIKDTNVLFWKFYENCTKNMPKNHKIILNFGIKYNIINTEVIKI